jgi:hypothetical protein
MWGNHCRQALPERPSTTAWRFDGACSTIPVALRAPEEEGEMEENELLEELKAIRHLVRQTWILVIVLVAVVAVPAVLLGCMTAGVILMEFLPH